MEKVLCCVYDLKSQLFGNPFTCINTAMALRSFSQAGRQHTTEICNFPSDFILYHIADFDDVTGKFTPVEPRDCTTPMPLN